MGEAKRRGTPAQRASEAQARAEAERQRQEQIAAERARAERAMLAALPPEQRDEERKRRLRCNQMIAMLAGMAVGLSAKD